MDKEPTNRVKVIIRGVEYTLRGEGSPEHLQAVADTVNKVMAEIAATTSFMDERRVAVLTALNLADELQRLRNENEELLSLLDDQTRGGHSP